MAKIVKTSDQEQALKKILENLGIIKTLNALLNAEEPAVTISAGRTRFNPGYEKETVDAMITEIRKPLVAEVRLAAKKYSVVLDDDDNRILDNRTDAEPVDDAEMPE